MYIYDNAMFQCGFTSPQELIDSIEEGIKNQVAPAYAIKPFFIVMV